MEAEIRAKIGGVTTPSPLSIKAPRRFGTPKWLSVSVTKKPIWVLPTIVALAGEGLNTFFLLHPIATEALLWKPGKKLLQVRFACDWHSGSSPKTTAERENNGRWQVETGETTQSIRTAAPTEPVMSRVHHQNAAVPTMHTVSAPEQQYTTSPDPPTAAVEAGRSSSTGSSGSAQQLSQEDHSKPFCASHASRLSFRVTGAASVARLEPLLLAGDWRHMGQRVEWSRVPGRDGGSAAGGDRIDFVWETTVLKQQLMEHRNATILNRLSGAQVLTT